MAYLRVKRKQIYYVFAFRKKTERKKLKIKANFVIDSLDSCRLLMNLWDDNIEIKSKIHKL